MSSVKSTQSEISRRHFMVVAGATAAGLASPGVAIAVEVLEDRVSTEGLGRLYYIQVESAPLARREAERLKDRLVNDLALGAEKGQCLLGAFGGDSLWTTRFVGGVRLDFACRTGNVGTPTRATLRGELAVKSFTI